MIKNKTKESLEVDDRLQHVAFIMDGNGRWAQKRSLPREMGHKTGAEVFKKITRYCGDIGIKAVTLYAFSTENWKRPKAEIDAILTLFKAYLYDALKNAAENNLRVKFLSDRTAFSDELKQLMFEVEDATAEYPLLLNIAINYGGRAEIISAVNNLIKAGATEITENDIERHLYTAHCSHPDLIIRSGAEMRLSNFLMWQSAYSELYFTDILWPDFKPKDVDRAVKEFYNRKRRFGGV